MSRRRLVVHILAYTLYGLAVLLVSLYFTFPYDLLQQRLGEWGARGQVRLTVARLGPGLPFGLRAHQVRLLRVQENAAVPLLHLQRLEIRPHLLSLASGRLRATLAGALYQGALRGEVRAGANGTRAWHVALQLEGLEVERYPLLRQYSGLTVRGQLSGEVTATVDARGRLQESAFALRLQAASFEKPADLRWPVPERLTCDLLQGRGKVTAGLLHIVAFTCQGDDLTLEARGTIRWRRPLATSQLDLRLQVRSQTAYKREVELLGALVRRRPDARGTLAFRIRGTLQRPRLGA